MSLNTVALVGNLTRDPELRDAGGTPVTTLRLAVNSRQKTGDTWGEKPNYFDIVLFGKQAENAAQYLEKGRPVAVSGRLDWREYTDKDGNRRQAVQVVADEVQYLGGRQDGEAREQAAPSAVEPPAPDMF